MVFLFTLIEGKNETKRKKNDFFYDFSQKCLVVRKTFTYFALKSMQSGHFSATNRMIRNNLNDVTNK